MSYANLTKYVSSTNNPHLNSIDVKDYTRLISEIIIEAKKEENTSVDLLDIGGGKGWGKFLYSRQDVNYYCLDIHSARTEDDITYLKGDITDPVLTLPLDFDIIFTKDTFEHILNPWDATNNVIENLKEGGYFIFLAPFSWRYHPSPYDAYRYTHVGVQYLFERYGKLRKILSCYINFGDINGFWENKKDFTMDGNPYPKCLELMYIGKKDSTHVFDKSDLDVDLSKDHSS